MNKVFTLFLLLIVPGVSNACECKNKSNYLEIAQEYSIVFVGQLVRSEIMQSGTHAAEFEFKVTDSIKGVTTGNYKVGSDITSCTLPMSLGKSYLIFTDSTGGISQCSGSSPLYEADFGQLDDLRQAGALN